MTYSTPELMLAGTAATIVRQPELSSPDNQGSFEPGNVAEAFAGLDD